MKNKKTYLKAVKITPHRFIDGVNVVEFKDMATGRPHWGECVIGEGIQPKVGSMYRITHTIYNES